jgi:hypothetical protein
MFASAVPVDVMPGENDPSNVTLPQQALHPCLLPLASRYSSLRTVTNPYDAEVAGVRLLGTSGQPQRDIARYAAASGVLTPGDELGLRAAVAEVRPSQPPPRPGRSRMRVAEGVGWGGGGGGGVSMLSWFASAPHRQLPPPPTIPAWPCHQAAAGERSSDADAAAAGDGDGDADDALSGGRRRRGDEAVGAKRRRPASASREGGGGGDVVDVDAPPSSLPSTPGRGGGDKALAMLAGTGAGAGYDERIAASQSRAARSAARGGDGGGGGGGGDVPEDEALAARMDHLDMLTNTLHWRHLAPTCPDTLACYPFYESDPFVLDHANLPNLLFAGGAAAYGSRLVADATGSVKVRVVSVPHFQSTHTAVLVDLNSPTLETQAISFAVTV